MVIEKLSHIIFERRHQMRKFSLTCTAIFLTASLVVPASAVDLNEELEAIGENVQLAVIEYYTAYQEAGQTIYFDDRTHQLGHHFVPGDPRRSGGDDISWLSDQRSLFLRLHS